MATLLSKNEEKSVEVKMKGYRLASRERLLVGSKKEIDKAVEFLDNNGFGGLYFDPEGDVEDYQNYELETALYSEECHGIRLFNE